MYLVIYQALNQFINQLCLSLYVERMAILWGKKSLYFTMLTYGVLNELGGSI